MSVPLPSLDALAADPAASATLTGEQRRTLVLRCATVLAALAAVPAGDAEAAARPPANEPPQQLLTVPAAAARLHLAPSYVYELIRRGQLAAVRIGPRYVRVSPEAVAAFVAPVDGTISSVLSNGHDRSRGASTPRAARPHTDRPRRPRLRPSDHGFAVGARSGAHPGADGEAAAPPRNHGA